jgi:transcriptional regulator with XRE-family HTH domain
MPSTLAATPCWPLPLETPNVRRARHAREMTQEDLADRARLSTRYLGSIERAAVSASVTVLGRLGQGATCGSLRTDPISTTQEALSF